MHTIFAKPSILMPILAFFHNLKSHNSETAHFNLTKVGSLMATRFITEDR